MRRRLTLATMLVLGFAAGCAGGNVRDGRAYFDRGYAAFEAGQWQKAREDFTRFLGTDPPAPQCAEVYYYRGLSEVHLERRAEAKADFLKALSSGPKPPITEFARVALGNVYYEEGDDASAIANYAPVVRAAPSDVPLERILLRMSISLQRLGKWSTADAYLSYLMQNYPQSAAADEARRRYRATAFAVQVGAFSSVSAATTEAARVRKAGFVPRIVQTVGKNAQPLQAVRIGSCKTYAEAAALAQKLHKAGFATVILP